jgi:hypothetical protein
MPFTNGGYPTYNLGNISMSKRSKLYLKPIQQQQYCGLCCDNSQTNLHQAKALVLNCMDFRLRDNISCHLNLLGYKNKYDEAILAGSSLGYNGFLAYSNWQQYLNDHIQLSYDLHDINEIIIIDHMKCGAYNAQYVLSTDSEEWDLHISNLKTAANTIHNTFNSIIPNLKIKCYIITINASDMTLTYQI